MDVTVCSRQSINPPQDSHAALPLVTTEPHIAVIATAVAAVTAAAAAVTAAAAAVTAAAVTAAAIAGVPAWRRPSDMFSLRAQMLACWPES